VAFLNANVMIIPSSDSEVLFVRVSGRTLRLEVDDETEVRGQLAGATVVNGTGRLDQDGTIEARTVEVVCP
jgi:hypothetical protein